MDKTELHNQIMFMLGEIKSDVKTIKEQTIKTNGRVDSLERESLQKQGKMSVLGAFGGVASSLIIIIIDHIFRRN